MFPLIQPRNTFPFCLCSALPDFFKSALSNLQLYAYDSAPLIPYSFYSRAFRRGSFMEWRVLWSPKPDDRNFLTPSSSLAQRELQVNVCSMSRSHSKAPLERRCHHMDTSHAIAVVGPRNATTHCTGERGSRRAERHSRLLNFEFFPGIWCSRTFHHSQMHLHKYLSHMQSSSPHPQFQKPGGIKPLPSLLRAS